MFFSPKYISILLIYNIKDKKIYKVSFSSDIYIRYIIYLHRNFLVNLQYKNALFFQKIYIFPKKVKMHIYSCCEIFCDMIMIRRDRHSLRTLHRQLDSLLVYFLYYLIILFFFLLCFFLRLISSYFVLIFIFSFFVVWVVVILFFSFSYASYCMYDLQCSCIYWYITIKVSSKKSFQPSIYVI